MKWKDILKVMGPAVMAVIPGAQPFIPLVIAGMTVAEESKKPGADKKQIAQQAVAIGIAAVNRTGKVHLDPAQGQQATDDVIDAIVSVTNLVQQQMPEDS